MLLGSCRYRRRQHEEGTMDALADKVAIVTGASSGIGHATAKLFALEGADVVVTARRRAELEALVAEIEEAGGRAVAVVGRSNLRQAAAPTHVSKGGLGHAASLDGVGDRCSCSVPTRCRSSGSCALGHEGEHCLGRRDAALDALLARLGQRFREHS